MRKICILFASIMALAAFAASIAIATNGWLTDFRNEYSQYVTAGSPLNSCATCHISDSDFGFNPYGNDLGGGFTAIENIDSDGDGFTNLEEIQAGFFPGDASSTPPVANNPPMADAGPNQTVFVGDTVTLDGSGSSDVDGDALTFTWALTPPAGSAAMLSDPTAVNPTFEVDVFGTYLVQLSVNDGIEDSASSMVNINTDNSAPLAGIGQIQNVVVGDTVILDGSGSSDVDGDALTFTWALTPPAGSAAILSDPTAVSPTFAVDVAGIYNVQLIVNDGTVDSATAESSVRADDISPPANTAPVADAGQDQSWLVGDTVNLDGSNSSDVDGNPLTFIWSFGTKPAGSNATFSDPLSAGPTFVADVAGDYIVQLIVNDGSVDSAPATVSVTAAEVAPPANTAPVADAGQDQNVSVGDMVALNGTGSRDGEGNAMTFSWTFTSMPAGSTATLLNPTSANPTFEPDRAGDYMVQLIVNDGIVNSAPDAAVITATAVQPPTGEEPPDDDPNEDHDGDERDGEDEGEEHEDGDDGEEGDELEEDEDDEHYEDDAKSDRRRRWARIRSMIRSWLSRWATYMRN